MPSLFKHILLLLLLLTCACTGEKHEPEPAIAKMAENPPEQTQDKPGEPVTKTVRFAFIDWPPYYGSKLTQHGPIGEITREAFKRRGYELQLDLMPWARCLEEARLGHVDGVLGLYKNKERAAYLLYSSKPVCFTNSGIVTFKDSSLKATNLQELKNERVGLLRSALISPDFDQADFLDKHEATTEEQVLKLLLAQRVSTIAGDISVFRHLMNAQNEQKPLKMLLLLNRGRLFNAFSKSVSRSGMLQREFNLGLEEIQRDGTYQAILMKYGMSDISAQLKRN